MHWIGWADIWISQNADMQRYIDAMMKWVVEVSEVMNDEALRRAGLSPLQRHFNLVLGPRVKKPKLRREQK